MSTGPAAPCARRVAPQVDDQRAVAVGRWSSDATTAVPRRPVTHAYAALSFLVSGSAHVEQAGAWRLEAGDVMLVPAGQPHRALTPARAEAWGLALCAPCLIADGAAALLEPFERVRDGAAAVVRIPAARRAFLTGLFRELAAGGEPAAAVGAAVERSLVTLILHEIDRAAAPHRPVGARAGVVVDSLRYIERNCLGRLTVVDVAAAVGRSPAHVTTALTRATGRSAGAWITTGRMAEARRRLLHADEPIDVVAERVGYADATHFIRTFRRAHGVTPAAWRTAHTGGAGSTLTPATAPRGPQARRSARGSASPPRARPTPRR
ncbi:MAG: AraC family transcriptional regulator [Kofleriaceae bacterium]